MSKHMFVPTLNHLIELEEKKSWILPRICLEQGILGEDGYRRASKAYDITITKMLNELPN